ncbi:MAG: hypothetical protein WBL21_02470 [Salinimicrobium sp.]
MRPNTIFLWVLLLLSSSVFAQEEILLKGKIEADSLMESSISIVNLTQKTGTTNAINGSFEISVKEEDILLFSSVQYETPQIKITPKIMEEGFLKIRLDLQINQLSEVRISNINLSGNLSKDLEDIVVFDQAAIGFPIRDFKRRTGIEKLQYDMNSDPVSLVVNTLNGNLARLKRAKKNYDFDKLIEKGIKSIPDAYFTEKLGIPEAQILPFVNLCAQNNEFEALVSQDDPLELMKFYFQKAPSFLKKEFELKVMDNGKETMHISTDY